MQTHPQLKKFFVRLLISLTTVTALAQVTGAGQSKKPSVVAAPPDAKIFAQMLRASVSRTGNSENVPLGFPLQQFASGAVGPGGLFLPAVKYDSGGTAPVSVAIADVNGDGKPDIVVANVCERFGCLGSSDGGV